MNRLTFLSVVDRSLHHASLRSRDHLPLSSPQALHTSKVVGRSDLCYHRSHHGLGDMGSLLRGPKHGLVFFHNHQVDCSLCQCGSRNCLMYSLHLRGVCYRHYYTIISNKFYGYWAAHLRYTSCILSDCQFLGYGRLSRTRCFEFAWTNLFLDSCDTVLRPNISAKRGKAVGTFS